MRQETAFKGEKKEEENLTRLHLIQVSGKRHVSRSSNKLDEFDPSKHRYLGEKRAQMGVKKK